MKKEDFYKMYMHCQTNYEFAHTTRKQLLFRKKKEKIWQYGEKLTLSLIKDSNRQSELPILTVKDAREIKEHICSLISCDEIPLIRDDIKAGIRVVAMNEITFIDHGTAVVKISKNGVQEITPPESISLQKTPQQLALPMLVSDGDLKVLMDTFNLSFEAFYKIVMFLVSILTGCSRIILVITGSPGSGKSTLASLIKKLIDPENSVLTNLPEKNSDLSLILSKSRVLVFDNLTDFNTRFANTLCMAATGGGIKRRTLYTTEETTTSEYESSVIITALHKPSQRADLLERMITIECPKLETPISEKELLKKFEDAKSGMLRGLYDLIHLGYKNENYEPMKTANRMQDLIHFMGRLEEPMGLEYGYAVKFCEQISKESRSEIAENSMLANVLEKIMKSYASASENPPEFRLKMSNPELLSLIHNRAPKSAFKDPDFPKTTSVLGRRLSELSAVLKTMGIEFSRVNSTKTKGRLTEIFFTDKQKKKMLKRQEKQPKKVELKEDLFGTDDAF